MKIISCIKELREQLRGQLHAAFDANDGQSAQGIFR